MSSGNKIVVLGAGISGLTAAWHLQRSLFNIPDSTVTVLEKEMRPGGWIDSWENENFFFEKGPRSLRICQDSRAALELIQNMGLADEVIGDAPVARIRYLWDGYKLQRVPDRFCRIFTSPLTRGFIPTFLREWFIPKSDVIDESVYAFISRRYSAEMAERLFDPLMSGIYGGDIRHLSAQACLSTLWSGEKSQGSILKWIFCRSPSKIPLPLDKHLRGHSLFTLKNGLATLPCALAEQIEDLRLGCGVSKLTFKEEGVLITLSDESTLTADRVISTLPAHALAFLLADSTPEVTRQLQAFSFASITAVHLGWRRSILPLEGFGYLVPSCFNEEILGAVFDSSAFPSQNREPSQTRITVMLGGSHRPDLTEASDDRCLEIALHALRHHIGIQMTPDIAAITRATNAIPQYEVGHSYNVARLRNTLSQQYPVLSLLGSSFDGVALTSCISNAMLIT